MAKKKPAGQKKPPPTPWMRVQLQRGEHEHFDSEPLSPTEEHPDQVVVDQVTAALRRMRNSVPKSARKRADAALADAIAWVEDRPPEGWTGRYGQSFPFDEEEPKSDFRFDVENLRGHNLRE